MGLQVWNGAILLAEFIICENCKFTDKHILEIGSGTGLVGIIAAKYSASVICTGKHCVVHVILFSNHRTLRMFSAHKK